MNKVGFQRGNSATKIGILFGVSLTFKVKDKSDSCRKSGSDRKVQNQNTCGYLETNLIFLKF